MLVQRECDASVHGVCVLEHAPCGPPTRCRAHLASSHAVHAVDGSDQMQYGSFSMLVTNWTRAGERRGGGGGAGLLMNKVLARTSCSCSRRPAVGCMTACTQARCLPRQFQGRPRTPAVLVACPCPTPRLHSRRRRHPRQPAAAAAAARSVEWQHGRVLLRRRVLGVRRYPSLRGWVRPRRVLQLHRQLYWRGEAARRVGGEGGRLLLPAAAAAAWACCCRCGRLVLLLLAWSCCCCCLRRVAACVCSCLWLRALFFL